MTEWSIEKVWGYGRGGNMLPSTELYSLLNKAIIFRVIRVFSKSDLLESIEMIPLFQEFKFRYNETSLYEKATLLTSMWKVH